MSPQKLAKTSDADWRYGPDKGDGVRTISYMALDESTEQHYRFRFMATDLPSGEHVAVNFRNFVSPPPGNQANLVRLKFFGTYVELQEVVNSSSAGSTTQPFATEENLWYDVLVIADGGNVRVYRSTDGGRMVQLFDESGIELIEDSNKFQLVASPNVGARFDDIRVNAPNLDIFAHLDEGSPCIEAGHTPTVIVNDEEKIVTFRDFADQQGPLDFDGDEVGADESPIFNLPSWLKLIEERL